MAKWYGLVGCVKSVESAPGVWTEEVEERNYYGEILRRSMQYPSSNFLNENVSVSNQISIVADAFANENFPYMKYLYLGGVKWKITNIEMQYPRLIFTLGGVYNAETES